MTCLPESTKHFLWTGHVHHKRHRPKVNSFTYGTYFLHLSLPLTPFCSCGTPDGLNDPLGQMGFFDADHCLGSKNSGSALLYVKTLLRDHSHSSTQSISLLTYPRCHGYAFKPVSFWFIQQGNTKTNTEMGDAAFGDNLLQLQSVVVEVNNTFGQRHMYVLHGVSWGQSVRVEKGFRVSPFCETAGYYVFSFHTIDHITIDHHDDVGLLIHTKIKGKCTPLTAKNLNQVQTKYRWQSWAVLVKIHWQAIKLLFKRVPYVPAVLTSKNNMPNQHNDSILLVDADIGVTVFHVDCTNYSLPVVVTNKENKMKQNKSR